MVLHKVVTYSIQNNRLLLRLLLSLLVVSNYCLLPINSENSLRYLRVEADFDSLLKNSQVSNGKANIPKIIHFIFGLKPKGHELEIGHYLAIKSAKMVNKDYEIYLWHHYLPTGPYWEKVKDMVVMKKTQIYTSIYGNAVDHFAHKADLVRLAVLHEYGGVYLDIDVISLKPYDDLLHNDFVMGTEGDGAGIGICNAVILSKPRAMFLRQWMESYQTFNQSIWNYHSVQYPLILARQYPNDIMVLQYDAFFWPLWNSNGMQSMFMRKDYNFDNNYAVHLWESNTRDWFLSRTTPKLIDQIDNALFCEIRRFISPGHDKRKDPNCQVLESSYYSDGIIGYWNFDEDTREKIVDSSENRVHGWALNGTSLILPQLGKRNRYRKFNGAGDFAIIPPIKQLTFDELTVACKFSLRGSPYPPKKVLLSLQHPQAYTLSIETAYRKGSKNLILRAIVSLKDNYGVYNIDEYKFGTLDDSHWHHVALTVSKRRNEIVLYIDGKKVGSNKWPPKAVDTTQTLKNLWLGTKLETSIRTQVRPLTYDFEGRMDDVILAHRAFSPEMIASIAQDPVEYFRNHKKVDLSHSKPGAIISKYNLESMNDIRDESNNQISIKKYKVPRHLAKDRTKAAHAGVEIIQLQNYIPTLNQDQLFIRMPQVFSMSWYVKLINDPGSNGPPVYFGTFMLNGVPLGVGVDLQTSYLTITNLRQPEYTFRHQFPSLTLKFGSNLYYHVALEFDFNAERFSAYCNEYLVINQEPLSTIKVKQMFNTVLSRVFIGNYRHAHVLRYATWSGSWRTGEGYVKSVIRPLIKVPPMLISTGEYQVEIKGDGDKESGGPLNYQLPSGKAFRYFRIKFTDIDNYRPPKRITPIIVVDKMLEYHISSYQSDTDDFIIDVSFEGGCEWISGPVQVKLKIVDVSVSIQWTHSRPTKKFRIL